mgnify:CR=1 FL=1
MTKTASQQTNTKPTNGLLRVLSLAAAATVMVLIVLYPRAIAPDSASVPHGWLELMLYGMSLLWLYGFGFTPEHRVLRILLHPLVGWVALALGAWKIFL